MLFDLYSNDKNKENINKNCMSIGGLGMSREFASALSMLTGHWTYSLGSIGKEVVRGVRVGGSRVMCMGERSGSYKDFVKEIVIQVEVSEGIVSSLC